MSIFPLKVGDPSILSGSFGSGRLGLTNAQLIRLFQSGYQSW
jgi:hypothetical protein